jgi:hypothetical protein
MIRVKKNKLNDWQVIKTPPAGGNQWGTINI